ncbi:hypothetical protein FRB95_001075 [Tulasnella sp. JGI-2019a]|nr:hypothetical protein FRB93_008400 [Tulasnella sp. JGI-2019a]KAG9032739.1 hypothetical protein FRB95_001075 [Tulasnella sp. JGI-2019a]
MSSFKRRIQSNTPHPPLGTRPNSVTSSIREISTGIPSLDDVLGGGQPLGTVIALLAPDPHSAWGELLQRHWIAQGLATAQRVVVVDGSGRRGREIVEGCMWMKGDDDNLGRDHDHEDRGGDGGEVKIAWRYEGMKKFETGVSSSTGGGSVKEGDIYLHQLDLTTKAPPATVNTAFETGQVRIIQTQNGSEMPGSPCALVLQQISGIIEGLGASKSHVAPLASATSRPVALRIAVPDLGGPDWNDSTPTQLLSFLYALRSLIQSHPVAVLVTFPPHLSVVSPRIGPGMRESAFLSKLGFICDGCITFEGFGADTALSATFPNYHGFVRVHKAPSVHSLLPPSHKLSILRGLSSPSSMSGGGGENNLGFRCTRRRFVIETLHLDVEGGVSERRTAPSAGGVTAYKETQIQRTKEPGLAAVQLEGPPGTPSPIDDSLPVPTEKKKARKAVAFDPIGTDMYDF